MKYDSASWHFDSDFPLGLTIENAGTHMGFYMAFIINNNLIGDLHKNISQRGLEGLIEKKITGRDFLFEFCQGKIDDNDLNELACKFTEYYYLTGMYLEDYTRLLGNKYQSIYHVEDTWENYKLIEEELNLRYREWELNNN